MLLPLPFGAKDACLLIEANVLQRFVLFQQVDRLAPESGGILLGYRRGHHVHVTEITVPTKRDVRRRFAFFRHSGDHQWLATRRWTQSGGTMDYVGEWHTHPEDDPTPSSVDLYHWREIALEAPRPMVFVIVGRQGNWYGAGFKRRLEQLFDRPN